MDIYLALVAAIVLANAVPAFAPPTWTILVFFLIQYDLKPYLLVVLGVLSATSGRAILAWYFRKFAEKIPSRWAKNMEAAGAYFESNSGKKYTLLGLFFLSPLSSAQLFEAAGLMKTVPLKPLFAAFAAGRTISYSLYVTGAAVVSATSFGEVIAHELRSPWAIAIQIAMILGLVALGSIDWQKRIKR